MYPGISLSVAEGCQQPSFAVFPTQRNGRGPGGVIRDGNLGTSSLAHLFIHIPDWSMTPTLLQLAALLAGKSALEEIGLSLEIASTLEQPCRIHRSLSLLPRPRRITVYGNAAGHAQLLNILGVSNELKHVSTDLFLDGIVADVAAVLMPFLTSRGLASGVMWKIS